MKDNNWGETERPQGCKKLEEGVREPQYYQHIKENQNCRHTWFGRLESKL